MLWLIVVGLSMGWMGCSHQPPESPVVSSRESSATVAVAEATPTAVTQPQIVALVGPLKITLNEVLSLTLEQEKAARPASATDTVAEVRKRIRANQLDQMIKRRLYLLGAKLNPAVVSDASVEAEYQAKLVEAGPAEVERLRKSAGLSKEEFQEKFRQYIREGMLIRTFLNQEIDAHLQFTEDQLKARYDADRESRFHRPDSYALYHLDRYLPRERESELPKLLEELEGIRNEVSKAIQDCPTAEGKGKLMIPFIQKYSQAQDAQSGYVYLYDTQEAKFDPEFVNRVRQATIGELSPVFQLAGNEKLVGGSFLLVFDKKPGIYAEYASVKHVVKGMMEEEKRKELNDALMQDLKSKFPVSIDEKALAQGVEDPLE